MQTSCCTVRSFGTCIVFGKNLHSFLKGTRGSRLSCRGHSLACCATCQRQRYHILGQKQPNKYAHSLFEAFQKVNHPKICISPILGLLVLLDTFSIQKYHQQMKPNPSNPYSNPSRPGLHSHSAPWPRWPPTLESFLYILATGFSAQQTGRGKKWCILRNR